MKKFACQLILVLLAHSIWDEQSCMLGSSITKNSKKNPDPNNYGCSGNVFNSNLFIYLCPGAFLLGQVPMDTWTLSIEQVSSTLADHNVCTKMNNINATWNWQIFELFHVQCPVRANRLRLILGHSIVRYVLQGLFSADVLALRCFVFEVGFEFWQPL